MTVRTIRTDLWIGDRVSIDDGDVCGIITGVELVDRSVLPSEICYRVDWFHAGINYRGTFVRWRLTERSDA